MLLLSLDTTTRFGSIAVTDGARLLASESWSSGVPHSERLMPAIEALLNKAKVSINSLQHISVGIGPGSFTGVRVSINAAKTLAYSLKIPVTGLVADEAILLSSPPSSADTASPAQAVYLSNAFRGLVFFSVWTHEAGRWSRTAEIQCCPIEEIYQSLPSRFIAIGDGWKDAAVSFRNDIVSRFEATQKFAEHPSAAEIGLALGRGVLSVQTFEWNQLLPLYLRASSAEEVKGISI
jgi:tRNA threonylcarbamoyladenosine biosynthesis protein TsaB